MKFRRVALGLAAPRFECAEGCGWEAHHLDQATFGLRVKGSRPTWLEVGGVADVVVLDPERQWTYDPAKGFSRSRNSPWAGEAMTGRPVATLVDGKLVYHVDRGVLLP